VGYQQNRSGLKALKTCRNSKHTVGGKGGGEWGGAALEGKLKREKICLNFVSQGSLYLLILTHSQQEATPPDYWYLMATLVVLVAEAVEPYSTTCIYLHRRHTPFA
jgi:hypothetical protein